MLMLHNCVDGIDERNKVDDNDGNEDGEDDSDRPLFSLVTGTYRHPKRYGGGGEAFLKIFYVST